MNSKAIIFGGGGQLGVELCREFERRQWSVVRFDRQALDITNPHKVEEAVANADPQVVVNAAAYNQVDIAETEASTAYQTNALAVRNLAMACRQADARFVHYSTDYVFDGTKGTPYVETDRTHPLGAYAVSKLAGELYAQAYLTDPLIHPHVRRFRPWWHVHAAWQFRRSDAAHGESKSPDSRGA